ncbi:MAG: hypothetical protein AB1489_13405 [Acidobacteriota bacterium]
MSIIGVVDIIGAIGTVGVTAIADLTYIVGVMDIKQWSNSELISRLVLSEQSPEEQQNIRYEFLDRFEHILVKQIRLAFHRLTPQSQATPEAICDVVDEIMLKLLNPNHQSIRQFSQQTDSQIEDYLAALAYRTALIYLYTKSKDKIP